MSRPSNKLIKNQREQRAAILAKAGGLRAARDTGQISRKINLTLSEALVLGLIEQGVKIFYSVFGHGSTEIGEVLRIYQAAGLVRVFGVRSEIEASHAAAALRWVTGEKAAVITSIGPGAMHAFAASIMPASNGIGVWYLFGDETTEDEGFNMQQVPAHEQGLFLKMMSIMGKAYSLHTPSALSVCLQRGSIIIDHPFRPGPFYLLMPMNTQAAWLDDFNLDELPAALSIKIGCAAGNFERAAKMIRSAKRVLLKVGGGGLNASEELTQLVDQSNGVLVHTPIATGCIPYSHSANMGVGGSKGSICGNYAMENADLLIAIGTRAVCQSDCSRTGYPNVRQVININADIEDSVHYNQTLHLVGEVKSTLRALNMALDQSHVLKDEVSWQAECVKQKQTWQEFKAKRIQNPILFDEYWQTPVLTQPAVIKTATDWAKENKVITFFDAGDVQANGFQIVEDEHSGLTFTDSGTSYMGFAVSALLATGTASKPFYALSLTGDGSFTMNPQILIDGAEHCAKGCISGLQKDQYGVDFATSQGVHVDYLAWARAVPGVLAIDGGKTLANLKSALKQSKAYTGLSLIYVQVYYGSDELGGMGVYGRWNVGNWCDDTQNLRHEIGL
jgi:3D-(3,5/4)-trihydroxycyclohexane-1,2-dione acylhydrolase (decyclizing)